MSVVVFHPSVAPFVQQAARAVHEAGALERFATTLAFGRRAVTEVPGDKVASHPWGELLRLAVGKMDRDGRLTDLVWERTEHYFDRRVARALRPGLRGVYGYEHSAWATFRRARELGIKVAYDVPAPEAGFVARLLAGELDKFPELRTAYHRHTARRDFRRNARRHEEWQQADLVVAASRFTLESYAGSGLDTGKGRIVPYGAPPPVNAEPAAAAQTPTFIWAGTFGVRKGAHYLLDAWRSGGFGRHARLLVFGTVALPQRVCNPLPEGIELRGPIARSELMAHYGRADALVFPTLCDGFGMVATEAWSRGLPVITTQRAGAADLLAHGSNGLLIRAGDSASIAEALEWFLRNRGELARMRESALATAARWQWSDYRRVLAGELRAAGLFG